MIKLCLRSDGGSSGYGRQYAQRLAVGRLGDISRQCSDLSSRWQSNWGIVDVHDTVQAVSKLAEMGKIDGERVAIRGGSAGGYTALGSLTDSKIFSAGISLYGVADIMLLVADTHKVCPPFWSRSKVA
jgi:dienelactone hydrolase